MGNPAARLAIAGSFSSPGGPKIEVSETAKKFGEMHVHLGKIVNGTVSVDDAAEFTISAPRRATLRANHSATHLLHAALRRKHGDHVAQKGSLVAQERLRFDISHPKPIAFADIAEIEQEVNALICQNDAVITRLMTPDEAAAEGTMALFGEKCGDEARVVSMGKRAEAPFSVELCGGTHVARIGDIGVFKIVSEGAVAAGIRRLEAMIGPAAAAYLAKRDGMLNDLADKLKVKAEDVSERVEALMEERRKLEKELGELRKKLATGADMGANRFKEVAGTRLAAVKLEDVHGKELKGMADELKKQMESGVTALISIKDGKASLVVALTDDLKDIYRNGNNRHFYQPQHPPCP